MVGQQILALFIGVRVPTSEQLKNSLWAVFFIIF